MSSHTSARAGSPFRAGLRDGIPIGLGYFAVAFSLGIAARHAGVSAFQGFLTSFLNNASAGQYAGFTLVAADASYWEMALVTLVTNARYLLMSCALSQRFSPKTPFFHRLLVGFAVTDEIFGISINRAGWIEPRYNYGAMVVAIPCWATGTALGILAGNLLPTQVVSALGVALFGMFLAVIVPPARKNRVVCGLVLGSFALSFIAAEWSLLAALSDGTRTILLTVLISVLAAVLFPIKEEEEAERCDA